MADIKQLLNVGGINTERVATEMFGNAVEEFAATPLNGMLQSAFWQSDSGTVNRNDGTWNATSYAYSLAASQFRPKQKFLFRVEFLFKPEILALFGQENAVWAKNFAFMVKEIDRPKVDFEYEEVNQYNFRTKVLKSIKHRALSMTFMDDVGNNVHEFFRFIMLAYSPIMRRSIGSGFNTADTNSLAQYSVGSGMQFSNAPSNTIDFATRGVLPTDIGNAIQAIKVTQIFMQPGSKHDLDTGAKEVAFFFINPRIDTFDLHNMTHEASEIMELEMVFDYDILVMTDMRVLQPLPEGKGLPPVGSAPGDAAPTGNQPGSVNPQGESNPYMKTLAALGGRAAAKLTNEKFGRYVRQVPGLGSVADTVGSIVGGGTKSLIGGMGGSINQSFAAPTRDIITDSSTAGSDFPQAIVGQIKGGG
jgi:hypothetical protein